MVGYFAYDYIKYSEPKLQLNHKTEFNDLDLMLFDSVICFDHYRQKIILITGCFTDDVETSYSEANARLLEMKALLQTGKKKSLNRFVLQVL